MRSDLVRLSELLKAQNASVTASALVALRRRIRAREVELGTRLLVTPKRGAPAQCSVSLLQTTMPELFRPSPSPPEAAVQEIFRRHDEELDEVHHEIGELKEAISELRQRDDQLLQKLEDLKARL